MENLKTFSVTIKRVINTWAGVAVSLSVITMVALLVAWVYGTPHQFNVTLAVLSAIIFGFSVFWSVWSVLVIKSLLSQWKKTIVDVDIVMQDVKKVRQAFEEIKNLDGK